MFANDPMSVIANTKSEVSQKDGMPPLLQEADSAHEFGVTQIGPQVIQCEVAENPYQSVLLRALHLYFRPS